MRKSTARRTHEPPLVSRVWVCGDVKEEMNDIGSISGTMMKTVLFVFLLMSSYEHQEVHICKKIFDIYV